MSRSRGQIFKSRSKVKDKITGLKFDIERSCNKKIQKCCIKAIPLLIQRLRQRLNFLTDNVTPIYPQNFVCMVHKIAN